MRKQPSVIIHVSPEFKQSLKMESARQNCSMLELTRKIAVTINNDGGEAAGVGKKGFRFRL